MPNKPCKCPGTDVIAHGTTREETWAATEAAAIAALPGLINKAKQDAEKAQDAAFDAALKFGDKACAGNACEAWFKKAPLDGPWTAYGAVEPYTKWLVRAGFSWQVLVKCELKPVDQKPEG